MKKQTCILIVILLIYSTVFATPRLPHVFGDNMVLQRGMPIPVWGWADKNEKITLHFNHQTKSVTADNNGKWRINLDKESAGGPYQLVVKGKETITFNNVLVGEVWVCSGQSNMEMPIAGWGNIKNYEQEIKDANYPNIHVLTLVRETASKPQDDIAPAEWKVCSPETAGDFTAVGYFFARELYNKLKVPVGLINTSWGGTMVETWISREAFDNSEEFTSMISQMKVLDLDSLIKQRTESTNKKIQSLQGGLPTTGEAATWKNISFDDKVWATMQLPGLWETQQLGELDGIVWYRKTIDVAAADAGKEATLELAMIDDNDITYVNEMKVGNTNSYNANRKYTIEAGVLKEGKNVIAVRVEDTGGGGGVYGESSDMKLTIGKTVISLAGPWTFKVESLLHSGSGKVGPNDYPTLLYNSMVHPLIPFAIKGVLWYQGEANAGRAYQYRKAFPLMIKDWRTQWKQGDFPFYFVQLASFGAGYGNSKTGSAWAELREAQAFTLSLPNTGMAVTTDIGEEKDIHPKNKQDVGKRLAAIALHKTYGVSSIYNGPKYQSMKIEGNKVIVTFNKISGDLSVKNQSKDVKGFEIAGANKQFYKAKGIIKGNTVVLSYDEVSKPVSVRYAWADYPGDANLFNKQGFPAGPFRTDKWKGITEGNKYAISK